MERHPTPRRREPQAVARMGPRGGPPDDDIIALGHRPFDAQPEIGECAKEDGMCPGLELLRAANGPDSE